MTTTNPWGLTAAEEAALDAMIVHGSDKVIARMLDKSAKTIESQIASARRRMGARDRAQAAVRWDRWRRSDGAGGQSVFCLASRACMWFAANPGRVLDTPSIAQLFHFESQKKIPKALQPAVEAGYLSCVIGRGRGRFNHYSSGPRIQQWRGE